VKVVEYVAPLGSDGRRRVRHVRVGARVLEFMVQYELKIGGEWYPVVRYDTAHGFVHQDILHWRGPAERRELPAGDYNLALSYAEEDLRRNWKSYRERFLREVKPA